MSFFKKNPLFCIVVTLCVAAFAVGLYFALNASGEVTKAERSLNSAEMQLRQLLNQAPAPTEENLEAAGQNLADLQERFSEIREDLQRGATLRTSSDGVSVLAGIQQYISKFQKATAAHVDEADESDPIEIPEDFGFGFKKYIKERPVPEDSRKISQLDKQRQILSYLLTRLIDAGPQSIKTVERELVEASKDDKAGFSIDPAISARVPGAIDTLAFRLTFTGYTDALRDFLNSLADFDLPIVVRRIEVERPTGRETLVAPTRVNNPNNIFDLFGGEEEEPAETAETDELTEEQKPVIEENISEFTVILEFIEVILPDTQNQEVSDPA